MFWQFHNFGNHLDYLNFKQYKKVTKKELLEELAEDTFIRLKPSSIHGIGVFAIRDIPSGCRKMFSKPKKDWVRLSKSKIKGLPVCSSDLIKNYCLSDDSNYFVPNYGFKIIDLVNFLNHSDFPNIKSVNNGDFFETIRNISAGEELLVNYGSIIDSPEHFNS
jgi:SET domain-containing protein